MAFGMGRNFGNAVGAIQVAITGDSISTPSSGYAASCYGEIWDAATAWNPTFGNYAISGTTIQDLDVSGIVSVLDPGAHPKWSGQIVSIAYGQNDSTQAVQTPEQAFVTLMEAVSAFQAAGATVIVCTAMTSYPNAPIANPFGCDITTETWKDDWNTLIKANSQINAVCDFAGIAAMNGNNWLNATDFYELGNIHPNATGQGLMETVFAATIDPLCASF